MVLIFKKVLFVLLPILLLSGCAGINEARVNIDYESRHGEVVIVVDDVPVKKISMGNGDADVLLKKGSHHLVVYENSKVVLDTLITVKNGYGASTWLSWNLGGFFFGAVLASGGNLFWATLVLFAPPIIIPENDARIAMRQSSLSKQLLAKKFKTSEDGTKLRYLGENGLKMQISGESNFVNEYENGMSISNIKVFCFNPQSKSVLLENDDGSLVKSIDYKNIRVCSGSKADLTCKVEEKSFWESFPCDSVEPQGTNVFLKDDKNNEYLGYSGMKAQIVGGSSLSNMYENSMAITYIEHFCFNPSGKEVLMQIDEKSEIMSFNPNKVHVCLGEKTHLECGLQGESFWNDYQCKAKD